jgi:hypothetical protein
LHDDAIFIALGTTQQTVIAERQDTARAATYAVQSSTCLYFEKEFHPIRRSSDQLKAVQLNASRRQSAAILTTQRRVNCSLAIRCCDVICPSEVLFFEVGRRP